LLTDLRSFDEAGGWYHQGFKSFGGWLAWRVGWDPITAREHVRVALKLGGLPLTDEALRRGELSYSKVRAMTRIATPANEAALLEQARYSTGAQLERICKKYAAVMRHDEEVQPADEEQRRYVKRSDTADGMVKLEAILHPEEAAIVWAALEKIATERCLERRPEPNASETASMESSVAGASAESSVQGAAESSVVASASADSGAGASAEASVAGASAESSVQDAAESSVAVGRGRCRGIGSRGRFRRIVGPGRFGVVGGRFHGIVGPTSADGIRRRLGRFSGIVGRRCFGRGRFRGIVGRGRFRESSVAALPRDRRSRALPRNRRSRALPRNRRSRALPRDRRSRRFRGIVGRGRFRGIVGRGRFRGIVGPTRGEAIRSGRSVDRDGAGNSSRDTPGASAGRSRHHGDGRRAGEA
jgi:hypothetical protein